MACLLLCVAMCRAVLVNKLSLEKYDIHWMANGDMYKMKTELSSQIWNKVGKVVVKCVCVCVCVCVCDD